MSTWTYTVIVDQDPDRFARKVSRKLNEGFVRCGSLVANDFESIVGTRVRWLYQAMTKEDKIHRPPSARHVGTGPK